MTCKHGLDRDLIDCRQCEAEERPAMADTELVALMAKQRDQWSGRKDYGLTFGHINELVEQQATSIRSLRKQLAQVEQTLRDFGYEVPGWIEHDGKREPMTLAGTLIFAFEKERAQLAQAHQLAVDKELEKAELSGKLIKERRAREEAEQNRDFFKNIAEWCVMPDVYELEKRRASAAEARAEQIEREVVKVSDDMTKWQDCGDRPDEWKMREWVLTLRALAPEQNAATTTTVKAPNGVMPNAVAQTETARLQSATHKGE
jgi:hypothetical protein